MKQFLIHFIESNSTAILLFLGWNFSAFLSAMPPLSENAPYLLRWFHDYLQQVAANMNKRTSYTAALPAPSLTAPDPPKR